MQPTRHRADCRRAFRNFDPVCARCRELAAGAPPRAGWTDRAATRRQDADRLAAIRAHDCRKAGCGPICTFGDW